MFSDTTVPFFKARLGHVGILTAALLGSPSAARAVAQEPPPLEAPDFELPKTETPPPAVRSPSPATTGSTSLPTPKPTEIKAPSPAIKPASTKAAGQTSTRATNNIAKPALNPATAPAISPTTRPDSRPVLAIPGLTMPSTRPSVSPYRPTASPSPTSVPLAAPLDTIPTQSGSQPSRSANFGGSSTTPRGMVHSSPTAGSPVSGAAPQSSNGVRDSIPLGIEPIADDPPTERPASNRTTANPATSPSRPTVRSTPGPVSNDYSGGSALIRRNLGRVRAYLGQAPENNGPQRPDGLIGPKFAAKLNEPEPDAVVKKRVEKQLRETLGDRVKSLEVRVSGRNVLVAAKPAWFWQRRGVKRSIETLPALDGYRVRVDLDD